MGANGGEWGQTGASGGEWGRGKGQRLQQHSTFNMYRHKRTEPNYQRTCSSSEEDVLGGEIVGRHDTIGVLLFWAEVCVVGVAITMSKSRMEDRKTR